jgi:hypothetical protein
VGGKELAEGGDGAFLLGVPNVLDGDGRRRRGLQTSMLPPWPPSLLAAASASASTRGAALASSSIGYTDASGLLSPRAGREEIEPPPSPLCFSASNRRRGYRTGDGVEVAGGDVWRRPAVATGVEVPSNQFTKSSSILTLSLSVASDLHCADRSSLQL